ncbi:hypothetical protein EMIT0P44_160035 [Pseudomonas sp. IT-P44]
MNDLVTVSKSSRASLAPTGVAQNL